MFHTFPINFVALGRLAFLLTAGTLAAGPLRAAEPTTVVTISENNRTQTVDARGGTVNIVGNGNKITVTGECQELTVQGNNNEVSVEAVAVVSVPGNKNRVTWSRALNGDKPQVSNLGSGNEVGTDSH